MENGQPTHTTHRFDPHTSKHFFPISVGITQTPTPLTKANPTARPTRTSIYANGIAGG